MNSIIREKATGRMGKVIGGDTRPTFTTIKMDGDWAPKSIPNYMFSAAYEYTRKPGA